ncbi:MAG: hypothetical protein PF542_01430 [Nanoarchaeota archaeon]|jgi:hypothetical protein|nr:hypothetical protein [Nanoarchaeota archaeon]
MKFKKITAIAGSLLMTGLTVAAASAAAFPAPFVKSGTADVAIVYGANADLVASNNVHTALGKFVTSTGAVTVEGGEAFTLEKSSDKFNFGDALDTIYPSLDDGDLESALADGTYDDGSIDEDFSQEITLSTSTHTLELFHDEDVNGDAPTIGFKIDKDDVVLKYTMDFDGSDVNVSEMAETDMPLLGSNYYVLSADEDTIELLDTAEKTALNRGETATVAGKAITVEYIGTNSVKFTVDGESTDSLEENEQYELDDGSYIIPTDIMTSAKDSVTDSVEFSIGSGKIVISQTEDNVQVNDEDVDGLEANYVIDSDIIDSDIIDSLTLTWVADDDMFLYEGETLVMPLFENVKVFYGGLDFPTDSETISMNNADTFTIEMDNYDFPVMWTDGETSPTIKSGEEYYELVLALENITYAAKGYDISDVANATSGWSNITLSNGTVVDINDQNETAALAETYLANVLPVQDGERFIATKITDDLSDVETMYYEIDTIDAGDADLVLKLEDLIEDNDLDFGDVADDNDRGDINVVLEEFSVDEDTAYLSFTDATDFNKLVSETGMVITLPTVTAIEDLDGNTVEFNFHEANEDGDLVTTGTDFTVEASLNGDKDVIYVTDAGTTDMDDDDDLYVGYVASELASKTTLDKSGDENDFEVEYYGEEVTADVQVIMGGEVSTAAAADFLPVKASEIDNVKSKNLVIVGGSCVNAAAETLLGGALCGEDFTAATGVGAGQFVIQEFVDGFAPGKTALLVAGYEQADTVNAVTYLTKTADVDTSEKIVKGMESVIDLA